MMAQRAHRITDGMGLEQSKADPCVCQKVDNGVRWRWSSLSTWTIILEADETAEIIKEFVVVERNESCGLYQGLGLLFYMGCHITRNRSEKKLWLSQRLFIQTISNSFGIIETSKIPASVWREAPVKA